MENDFDWKAYAIRLVEFIENAEVQSGVCCCGDSMEGHANPMNCGHSPVDMWSYSVLGIREEFDQLIANSK